MTLPRLLIALCLLAATARGAHADEAGLRAARHHFERGEKLYALTRFSEALDAYQRAFDAAPLADFLFNIGQCYRNLGDYEAATFSYRKYLTLAPDAPNRERVEQLVAELEAQQDQRTTRRLGLGPRGAAPAPSRPTAARPIHQTWWFWTGIGVVVAGAGGLVIYEASRTEGPPPTRLGNIVFGE